MAQALSLPNHYTVLRVSPLAPVETIREAYKCLALRFHPDKSRDVRATERFQRLAEAWECLRDSETRSAYDEELRRTHINAFRAANAGENTGWDEVRRRKEEVDQKVRANWQAGEFPAFHNDLERQQRARDWKDAARQEYIGRLEAWTTYRRGMIEKVKECATVVKRHDHDLKAQTRFSHADMAAQFEQAIVRSKELGHQMEDDATIKAKLMKAWKDHIESLGLKLHEARTKFQSLVTELELARTRYEQEEADERFGRIQQALDILGPRELNVPLFSMIDRRGQAINYWNALSKIRTSAKCFSSLEGTSEGPWHHPGEWQRTTGEHTCFKCAQNAYHIVPECAPVKCPGCDMIICHNCYRDLRLLREYHEWIMAPVRDGEDFLFSLDFMSTADHIPAVESPAGYYRVFDAGYRHLND